MTFKKHPSGKEVYYNWPWRTGRLVTSAAAKNGIMVRDSITYTVGGIIAVLAYLLDPEVPLTRTIGWVMAVAFLGCFVERYRYLSKLPRIEIEVTEELSKARPSKRHDAPLPMTVAEIDKDYIKERSLGDGVVATGIGAFMTGAMLYVAITQSGENQLPWFFLAPLLLAGLIVLYVGIRILVGKRSSRRGR